jgi:glycine/D-amino acid oxidase-like deaminating enzyme
VWLWHAGRPKRQFPSLSGERDVSVAIVGGGMTGALVAHAFASAGVSTALLEASFLGRGSPAASSALLLQEPDLELTALARRYGLKASRRIWQMSQESVLGLVALLTRLRIECDLQTRDASTTRPMMRRPSGCVEKGRSAHKRGVPPSGLLEQISEGLTGISGRGAIRTEGSAQFDPYRACLAGSRWAVGGNGMTLGFLAARLLLERWQRATTDDHAFFEFGRTRQ